MSLGGLLFSVGETQVGRCIWETGKNGGTERSGGGGYSKGVLYERKN